jgi:hypothetical protein
MSRKRTKLIHQGRYAAEVPIELIEEMLPLRMAAYSY